MDSDSDNSNGCTWKDREKKLSFPKIPDAFGEDGGKFYKDYNDLAEELDQDMSGLFAGVNSAFLALTLPQLSANPVDDTNALLSQLVKGHNNSTQQADDLPSASFSPPPTICSVNGLFSASLTLALLSSFIAVLGQQWLVQYRKRTGGGTEHQRWEEVRRYVGAKRWRLEPILGHALPTLLQISLLIFCVAFALFLNTLNPSISYGVATLMILVAAVVLLFAVCAAWDQWCPFKSPLSRFLQITLPPCFLFLGHVAAAGIRVGLTTAKSAQLSIRSIVLSVTNPRRRVRHRDVSLEETVKFSHKLSNAVVAWFRAHSSRPADYIEDLQARVLKRLICTSEDPKVLVQAATNLRAYKDSEGLRSLLRDDDFLDRLRDLFHTSYREKGENTARAVEAGVFGSAFLHVILSAGSIDDFCSRKGWITLTRRTRHEVCSQLANEGEKLIGLAKLIENGKCASCYRCLNFAFMARMIGTLVAPSQRGDLPKAYQCGFDKWPWSATRRVRCLTAWGVVVSKEWSSLQNQERESQDTWCMEKARGSIELYRQERNVERTCQLVSDAAATLDSHWEGRPDIKDFLELLSRISKDLPNKDYYNRGTILRSLGLVLMSIEKMVRNPKVSSDERETLRKQRKACFEAYGYELPCWELGEPKVLEIWRAALTSLFDFLDWLKGVFETDPTMMENPLVLELLQEMLDGMPSGEQLSSMTPETCKEYSRVRSVIASSVATFESIIEVEESRRTDEV
ncbi:hypothetical protein FS837_008668 [Tulasnella sp. UAMH 9824]|nr:hypothetical protein FS837_008668 [Tulasnella sp. UAMH 9824]